MTGLQNWAKQNNTTAEEIQALLISSGLDPKSIIGESAYTEEPVPSGRTTALMGLLERGRNGEIEVSLDNVAAVLGIDANSITAASGQLDGISVTDNSVNSKDLPTLIERLTTTLSGPAAGEPEACDANNDDCNNGDNTGAAPDAAETAETPDTNTSETPDDDAAETSGTTGEPEPPAPAPAAKPARGRKTKATEETPAGEFVRKKTKYSINKNSLKVIDEAIMGAATGSEDDLMREQRMLLLSMPEHKPQDVAVMSDKQVTDLVGDNYIQLHVGGGVVFMTKRCYNNLLNVLTTDDAYYIPLTTEPEEAQNNQNESQE